MPYLDFDCPVCDGKGCDKCGGSGRARAHYRGSRKLSPEDRQFLAGIMKNIVAHFNEKKRGECMLSPEQLEEIKARNAARSPGRWQWSQSYQFATDWQEGDHWCLHNPDNPDLGAGDGYSRTINQYLVTETIQTFDGQGQRLDLTPDFQFVAHAPEDITALVTEVERLQRLKLYIWRKVFEVYGYGIAFAVAGSKEEALALISQAYEKANGLPLEQSEYYAGFDLEPEVLEIPAAGWEYGADG